MGRHFLSRPAVALRMHHPSPPRDTPLGPFGPSGPWAFGPLGLLAPGACWLISPSSFVEPFGLLGPLNIFNCLGPLAPLGPWALSTSRALRPLGTSALGALRPLGPWDLALHPSFGLSASWDLRIFSTASARWPLGPFGPFDLSCPSATYEKVHDVCFSFCKNGNAPIIILKEIANSDK